MTKTEIADAQATIRELCGIIRDHEKENTLLRKVNNELLSQMERIAYEAGTEKCPRLRNLALSAINHAANDMRFGMQEKKEGE